jgi:peptidoglycan/xylan/chitin deacetylase (PgdA/CDA1 family)
MMRLAGSARTQLKRYMKATGALFGLLRVAPTYPVILSYHSVRERPETVEHSIGRAITHSAAVFERQMRLIAERFAPVTLDDILLSLQGKLRLPRRAVAVTFDDGYSDSHEIAAPILARHGIAAAFYVSTGPIRDDSELWFLRLRHAFAGATSADWEDPGTHVVHRLADPAARDEAYCAAGRLCAVLVGDEQYAMLERIEAALAPRAKLDQRFMMSWEQIAALRRAGHIIGGHTLYHPNLAQIDADRALAEIAGSKADLERAVGEPVVHFAYPTPFLIEPHYSEHTMDLTRRLGYRTAVTWLCGAVRRSSSPLALPRVPAPLDVEEFTWVLQANMLGYAT